MGATLLDLLAYFSDLHLSMDFVDVTGSWAEFNSPADVARFVLGTKAETLHRLEPLVETSRIGKQVSFTVMQWQSDLEYYLNVK